MSKKKIQINIPKPCHKKFADMIPAHGGNFCDSCEKIIVDFTKMTDHEIAKIFLKNKGKICGQFRKNQLDRNINLPSLHLTNSYRGKAASILLSGLLTTGITNAQNLLPTPQIIESQQTEEGKTQRSQLKFSEKNSSTQPRVFKFLITDDSGETLIGANIILKGNEKIGTTTDIDGTAMLTINNSDLENEITFAISYTGYQTEEINFKKNELDFNKINEVILKMREGESSIGIIVISYAKPTTLYQVVKNWLYKLRYNREDRVEKREERKRLRKEKRNNKKLVKQMERGKTSKQKSDSKIIQLPVQQFSISLKNVSPNPFIHEINLTIDSKIKTDIQISLFNISGQKIYQVTQGLIKGNQNINLNLKNINLKDGEYILHLREKNGQVQSRKVIRISNR